MKIKYELEFDFTNEIHQKIAEEVEYLLHRFRKSKFIEYDCQVLEVTIENIIGENLSDEEVKIIMEQYDKIKG